MAYILWCICHCFCSHHSSLQMSLRGQNLHLFCNWRWAYCLLLNCIFNELHAITKMLLSKDNFLFFIFASVLYCNIHIPQLKQTYKKLLRFIYKGFFYVNIKLNIKAFFYKMSFLFKSTVFVADFMDFSLELTSARTIKIKLETSVLYYLSFF